MWLRISIVISLLAFATRTEQKDDTISLLKSALKLAPSSQFENTLLRSVRDTLNPRLRDPDATKALASILAFDHRTMTPFNFMYHLSDLSNMPLFARLVKDSKIHNKGEAIKLFSYLADPRHMNMDHAVKTLKKFDPESFDEIVKLVLQYTRSVLTKQYGDKYDSITKYINDDDIRALYKIIFKAIKETDNEDLIWLASTVRNRIFKTKDKATGILRGQVDSNEWRNMDDATLWSKALEVVHDLKRYNKFDTLKDHGTEITTVEKNAIIHFLDVLVDDIKTRAGDLNNADLSEELAGLFDKQFGFLKDKLDLSDSQKFGSKVESHIIEWQNLNHDSARSKLDQWKTDLEDIKTWFDPAVINTTFLDTAITVMRDMKVPDPVVDYFTDTLLIALNKVDSKKINEIAVDLYSENENTNNSKIYKSWRKVLTTLLKDRLTNYTKTESDKDENVSIDEVKTTTFKEIEKINATRISKLFNEFIQDLASLKDENLVDTVVDARNVYRDWFSIVTDRESDYNPKTLLKSINETTLKHAARLILDYYKLSNITKVSELCLGDNEEFRITQKDLKKRVADFFNDTEKRFNEVKDGDFALEKLKFEDISSFINQYLDDLDLNKTCADLTSVLNSVKEFDNPKTDEVLQVAWQSFDRARTQILEDTVNKYNVNSTINVFSEIEKAVNEKYQSNIVLEYLNSFIDRLKTHDFNKNKND